MQKREKTRQGGVGTVKLLAILAAASFLAFYLTFLASLLFKGIFCFFAATFKTVFTPVFALRNIGGPESLVGERFLALFGFGHRNTFNLSF
jgi:hypothetical protein